jgi:hypothetical protein
LLSDQKNNAGHLLHVTFIAENLINREFPHCFVASSYVKSQAPRRKPNYWNNALRNPAINGTNTDTIAQSDVSLSVEPG